MHLLTFPSAPSVGSCYILHFCSLIFNLTIYHRSHKYWCFSGILSRFSLLSLHTVNGVTPLVVLVTFMLIPRCSQPTSAHRTPTHLFIIASMGTNTQLSISGSSNIIHPISNLEIWHHLSYSPFLFNHILSITKPIVSTSLISFEPISFPYSDHHFCNASHLLVGVF